MIIPDRESTSSMYDRLNFIKMRRRGVSIETTLNNAINEEMQNVISEVAQITHELKENQRESNRVVNALLEEVERIDVTQAGEIQVNNLNQTLHRIKKIQIDLFEKMSSGEKDLFEQQQKSDELECMLNYFRNALNVKDSTLSSQDTLLTIGAALSHYIARNRT